tara:strand:- start:314 stop:523 length:210 start_codon:yes stop_codon:yes gene_type:complete
MKANQVQIRNQPKEWYDQDNEKYREILEENNIAIDFNIENETFTVTLNKNTLNKIKDKEILIKIGGQNE